MKDVRWCTEETRWLGMFGPNVSPRTRTIERDGDPQRCTPHIKRHQKTNDFGVCHAVDLMTRFIRELDSRDITPRQRKRAIHSFKRRITYKQTRRI